MNVNLTNQEGAALVLLWGDNTNWDGVPELRRRLVGAAITKIMGALERSTPDAQEAAT